MKEKTYNLNPSTEAEFFEELNRIFDDYDESFLNDYEFLRRLNHYINYQKQHRWLGVVLEDTYIPTVSAENALGPIRIDRIKNIICSRALKNYLPILAHKMGPRKIKPNPISQKRNTRRRFR